ncbi:MAG: beta-ketoacyl-ACP synthase III [Anaerolineae bacterium]
MAGRPIAIIGTGLYVPAEIVTNQDLASYLDTTDDWIQSKVGVKERRRAADGESTSDLAVAAARQALQRAGIEPSDLDLIVLATSSPDMIQPPTASIVQGKLGAYNAAAFDVGAVCAGGVYALDVAAAMMQSHAMYTHTLVIGAETYSRILDWNDRETCVYFGDGAGAAVLGHVSDGYGLCHSVLGTDGRAWDTITFLGGGSRHPASEDTVRNGLHKFRMRGKDVWTFATTVVPNAVELALTQAGMAAQDLDLVIFHQANINIIRANMERLGLSMCKTHICLDRYANTSGASVLMALHEAVERGKLCSGDTVALVGFGGGLSWAVSIWVWA